MKVLVVDDDVTITAVIESYLFVKNIDIVAVNSVYDAIQQLKTKEFDVILSDVNMPNINGFEFLLWLKKNHIKSHIIIMTAQANDKAKEVYHSYGVLKYLSKPLELSELLDTINQTAKSSFTSNVKEITLFDYIQIMSLSKKTNVLSITSPLTELTGYLYFKDGEIVEAEYGNEKGEEAFFKIIKINGGAIEEIQKPITSESIKMPSMSLLFKATQIIDEENAKHPSTNSKYSILIVDDEPLTLMIIEKTLSKNTDLELYLVDSPGEAAILLQERYFDLVISDINMPGINGLELLLWMKKNNIHSKVIMMTGKGSSDIKNFAINSGAARYLEKPLDFNELNKIIDQDRHSGFSGNVNEIGIFDYIQMIALSRKTKTVVIKSPLTYNEGFIYFKNGNIVHAEYENLKGIDALFKMLNISGGIISEIDKTSTETTITNSLPSILMKATGFIEQENNKKENIQIDEKIISSIETKLRTIATQSEQKTVIIVNSPNQVQPPPPPPNADKLNIPLINIKRKATGPLNLPPEETNSSYLKKFDALKYLVPEVSERGERAIKDSNTALSIYQLLKRIDGKSSLESIYQNNYHHLSLIEFFEKFDTVRNYINIKNISPEKININIFQLIIHSKFMTPEHLKNIIDSYLQAPGHNATDKTFISGDFLIDLDLIRFKELNTINSLLNKINRLIEN